MPRPLDRLTIKNASGPFATQLKSELEPWSVTVANAINLQVGPAIASADTISPSSPAHHITGTATINTISVPAGWIGMWIFIPDGLYKLGTSGNIAIASNAVVGRPMFMVYDAGTQLFYPSY